MFSLPKILIHKSSTTPESFLALDIGTSSVKAALFTNVSGDKVKLLGFSRYPIEDGSQIQNSCLSAYNSIKSSLQNPPHIENVIFGLSANICHLATTTVKITRNKPLEPISKKEVAKITEKIQNAAYIESSRSLADKIGSVEVETKLLNSEYIYTIVDGIEVASLEGYKGEKVEASLFSAFTTADTVLELTTIAKSLNLKIAAVTSNIYTIVKAIKQNSGPKANFVIIDIGGTTTDVAIIFGGGVESCLSISLGVSDIVETISEELKIGIPEAQRLLDMYAGKNLDKESNDKIEHLVQEVCSIWVLGMEHLFKEFEGIKSFPEDLILAGWGSAITNYKNSLTGDWAKDIPFKNPPVFRNFDVSSLDFIEYDKKDILNREGATLSLSLSAFDLWQD